MERLDKIIAEQTEYSRKDVKRLIEHRRVKVNDVVTLKSNIKINLDKDIIKIDEKAIDIKKNVYLILNKPKGYVSATVDENDKTVLELVPDEFKHRNLFPAGRLDKDTTGLMIITDDGKFAHDILSPRKHVDKIYIARIDIPITEEMIEGFRNGIQLNDGECKPASLNKIDTYIGEVILKEGRYHQIKRMFGCFDAKVVELKRIKIGELELPNDLSVGECRELTQQELEKIKEKG